MNNNELKIRSFRKAIGDNSFLEIYHRLLLKENLDEKEKIYLLKTAILFLNFGDDNLKKLGYRIVLNYSLQYSDYKALYDVAINFNHIPISKVIEKNFFDDTNIDKHFFPLYFYSYQENFKYGDYYITEGQKKLIEFAKNNSNFVIVAPTSYGKSEIIINKIYDNLDKKTCIIVPSKALLAQTKKRILNKSNDNNINRIITHPEMYKGTEQSFVAVLTQERLLRLLEQNQSLYLDLVLIDEAHNLFEDDNRAILLAQTLMILKKRNVQTIFNFFSPFIADANSLIVKNLNYDLSLEKTDEFIKIEKFFLCDLNNDKKLYLYDQFTNDFIDTSQNFENEITLIENNRANKNIIYFNRPKHIELFTKELLASLPDIENEEINTVINDISDYIHPDYNLIRSIKKGILYHHGGMPEVIRLFVEDLFSNNQQLSFIITSSTLLEGVNIPADRIFLFSLKKGRKKLTKSQFKNLIGRINRFSEIFKNNNANLNLLEPEIYIVGNKYSDSRINPRKFLSQHAKIDIKINDDVKNVLLKEDDKLNQEEKERLHNSLEYVENIERGVTDIENIFYATTNIGRLCYLYNVYDFDIKQNENIIDNNLQKYLNKHYQLIENANQLMEALFFIFLQDVDILDNNIIRLKNIEARKFYSMFIKWRATSASYKEMVSNITRYWNSLPYSEKLIYIGEKWGEIKRQETDHKPLYVDIREREQSFLINLAILKIKEEQDFVEYYLLKYVEILNELSLVEKRFYDRIKYGTDDVKKIIMLKNGFSLELAKCLSKSDYEEYILINEETDEVNLNKEIINKMEENNENKILIFETKYHIRIT